VGQDAGTDSGAIAGEAGTDSGSSDVRSSGDNNSGCGCRNAGSSTYGSSALAGLGAVALIGALRLRRRRVFVAR
jgi:hypothetical protein